MVEQFAGKLRLPSETVDNPRLRGLPKPFKGYDFRKRFDYVEYQRFSEHFTQPVVYFQQFCLRRKDFRARKPCSSGKKIAPLNGDVFFRKIRVKPTFTYGDDRRFGGEGA